MKIKLIKFISVLFFALLFVAPVALVSTEATSRHSRFSEGDRDPPFVCKQCKQVKDPNLSKKRNGFSATRLLEPKREYEDATGEQNNLVVFVAFADQDTSNDTSELEEKAREALFGGEGTESASEYLKEVSQGKMSLKGDILSGWVTLPKASEEYGYGQGLSNFDYQGIFNDTIAAIDDRVYFPDFTRIIIFIQGKWGFATGSIGKWNGIESDDGTFDIGICWIGESSVDDQDTLRHEILHTLGGLHSGSIYLKDNDACERLCPNQEITKADDTTWPPLECSTEEYGDGSCILGHGRGHPSAFIKYKLGWFNEDQILVITESATVTLIPRASSLEGIKMIIIVAKDADGTTKTYFLEYYKRLTGFDSTNKNGTKVLLRFFNEKEELNDSGTFLFLKKNETEEESYYTTLNLIKESFCDTENGIKIDFVSESIGEEMAEENSYVELQVTLSCPEEKSPSISVSPDYTQTLAGENVISEISVSNEMTAAGCGTRTVNLETALPNANWSAVFSPSSTIELGPGEAGTITVAIWVPETAPANSYGLDFKATDQESGLSGEASMTIEVLQPPPTPPPTPTPTPTPVPTVPSEEMILSVTINGQDATTNSIVVARKSWVNVGVEARDSEGVILRADKISCKMTKSNGKVVYKNRPNGVFRFRVGKRGRYSLEIEVSSGGYRPASFQTSFKVE